MHRGGVAGAHLPVITYDHADYHSQNAQISEGFDEASRSDTVSLGITMGKQYFSNAHDRYAFSVVLATDLSIALKCTETQILIQDIFNGKHGTHVLLCFASTELHERGSAAQSLGQKLMRDAHVGNSDLCSLLPSIGSVHWIPDRARTGLNSRYQSEHNGATNRSQLSHLDTQRAETMEECKMRNPTRKLARGSILRKDNDEIDEGVRGIVSDDKWDKLLKVKVGFAPARDKVAEAHAIFDKLDLDSSDTLTHAEIVTGMMLNGFAQDDVASRLPSLYRAMDSDSTSVFSRKAFVEHWVLYKETDPSKIFQRLDVGQSGFLMPDELLAGLLEEGWELSKIHERLPKIFYKLDQDGDGAMSEEEFRNFFGEFHSAAGGGLSGQMRWAGNRLPAIPQSLTVLPQGLTVLPANLKVTAQHGIGGAPQGAAGVFSEIMTTTSEILGVVGQAIIQPLPPHIQDMIMPLPSTRSTRSVTTGRPLAVDTYGRATSMMRRQRHSPREMLANIVTNPFQTSDSNDESSGWTAAMRHRLTDAALPTSYQAAALSLLSMPSISLFGTQSSSTEPGPATGPLKTSTASSPKPVPGACMLVAIYLYLACNVILCFPTRHFR